MCWWFEPNETEKGQNINQVVVTLLKQFILILKQCQMEDGGYLVGEGEWIRVCYSIPCFPSLTHCWGDYSASLYPIPAWSLGIHRLTHTSAHTDKLQNSPSDVEPWRFGSCCNSQGRITWMEGQCPVSIPVHWAEKHQQPGVHHGVWESLVQIPADGADHDDDGQTG